jgi:REP element-mobilizing transposase RayT
MANTYTQIYIHLIFAVQNRNALIHPEWEDQLYKYITGIVQNKGHKMLAINGTQDHIHLYIGMKLDCSVSEIVREIKKSSNAFIKDKQFTRFPFRWQAGFGAFSYADSQLDSVIKYIVNQKEHHRKKTFKEEYLDVLNKFHVDYDPKYLFDWIE